MKNPIYLLFWLLVLGGILNYFISGPSFGQEDREMMKNAYVEYTRGETAESVGERRDAFNQALDNYKKLENMAQLEFGNGRLYYNLANTYFQLGEYPWAVLYYHRAINLMPRDPRPRNNLQIAQKKLGIESEVVRSPFRRILFFIYNLSLPEKIQLFFFLMLSTLVLASLYIWKEQQWMKKTGILFTVLSSVMLMILGYNYYFNPIEAVLVKSTALYRDAGFQYAQVTEDPILSGNKVEIIDSINNGSWLKVVTHDGKLGYVPAESIRII